MKTNIQTLILTLAMAAAAAAQGSLTPPPGPPGPVMKSLDEVEARIPLVAGQPGVTVAGSGEITISAPGSYYLTKNLTCTGSTSCINVGSHNVTLDLNGFTVTRTTGAEADTAGIKIHGAAGQMVMIRNGFIVGGGVAAGFNFAIDTTDGFHGRVHVENVHCSKVRGGIILNYEESRNSVRNCSVEISGGEGIRAELVTDCVVRDTMSHGIVANVAKACSVVQRAGYTGHGIVGSPSGGGIKGVSAASDCYVIISSTGNGIVMSTVTNCSIMTNNSVAIDCYLATSSRASRTAGGLALNATTAVGCAVLLGTHTVTNKYNMP